MAESHLRPQKYMKRMCLKYQDVKDINHKVNTCSSLRLCDGVSHY